MADVAPVAHLHSAIQKINKPITYSFHIRRRQGISLSSLLFCRGFVKKNLLFEKSNLLGEMSKGFPLRGSCRAYARLMRCSHEVALNRTDDVL